MTEEGGDLIRKNGINGVSVTPSVNNNLSSTTTTTTTATSGSSITTVAANNNNNCNNHYSIDEFVHNKSPKRPAASATTSGSGLGGGTDTPPSPSIQNHNHSLLHNHDKSPGPGVPPTSGGGSTKTTTSGGRLQFFKDGKFILELARAREGEKTSWVSVPAVPRKTYWPPSIATSTSHNFHKHESSTSLSFSDDNSSIQSSPWQRDHCWKQTTPRHNISSEMTLYYYRPNALKLSKLSVNALRIKRRRPYDTTNKYKLSFCKVKKKALNGDAKPNDKVNSSAVVVKVEKTENNNENGNDSMDDSEGGGGGGDGGPNVSTTNSINNGIEQNNCNENHNNNNNNNNMECNNSEETKTSDDIDVDGNDNDDANANAIGNRNGNGTNSDDSEDIEVEEKFKIVRNKTEKTSNLISIVQKLIDKIPANLVLSGNNKSKDNNTSTIASTTSQLSASATTNSSSTQSHHHQPQHHHHHHHSHHHSHQHVSPRKRILRDLEKVSLDDSTKRLRSKNNINTNYNKIINSNGTVTPITTTTSPSLSLITTPVSRPISSYSITSLLAHSNSSSNSSSSSNNINNNHNNSSNCNTNDNKKENITSQQQQQHQSPQSPELQAHHNNKYDPTTTPLSSFKRKSPSYQNQHHNNNITSSSPSSGIDYTISNNYPFMLGRSPDMSPSPEQQHGFTRYRHNPYSTSGGVPASGTSGNHHQSSPNYPRFTPSPNNTLEKYRSSSSNSSNYHPGGSPHHHLLANNLSNNNNNNSSSNSNNNSSPSHLNHLNYSRQQSPTSSIHGYQQYYHQNLHNSNSNNNHQIKSSPPPTPLNNYYNRIRERDKSPSVSPNNDRHYNNSNSTNNNNHNLHSTSASTPSTSTSPTTPSTTTTTTSIRNVPKKTAALRQQFESPPSLISKNDENMDNNQHKMHDYSDMKTASLSGIDVDNTPNSLIRPTLIPSSSAQQQHNPHLQPPHPGMYYMYPPHIAAAMAAAAAAAVASSPSATSPSSAQSSVVAAAAAAAAAQQSSYYYPYPYRHPLWSPYAASVGQINHHPLNRIPLLNYPPGLGPPTHLTNTSNPWATLPSNSLSSLSASLAEDDAAYSKLKDENNSDVPLNLSKH